MGNKKKAKKKKSQKKQAKPVSAIEASSKAQGDEIPSSEIPVQPFSPSGPMMTDVGPGVVEVTGVLPGEIGDYVEGLLSLGDGSARRRFELGVEMNGIQVWQLIGGPDSYETVTVFANRGQRANLLHHMEVCQKQWPVALDSHPTEEQLEQLFIVLRYWTRQIGLG